MYVLRRTRFFESTNNDDRGLFLWKHNGWDTLLSPIVTNVILKF